jgi:hypothetical protein
MSNLLLVPWRNRVLMLAVAATLLVLVGLRIQLISSYRFDIAGAEFNVIHGVQKVMLGRTLYSDPEQAPFDIVQYTPVYYFICGGIGTALGIDAFDVRAVYLLSRVLSLLLNLFTAWVVFRILRTQGVDRWWALVAAMLVFAAFSEHFYSRIDSLYALLFVASLGALLKALPGNALREWAIAGVLAVLCFMAKQTAVLLLLLVPLYLLLAGRWRPFAIISGSMAITAVVCGALLLLLAPAELLWKNMVGGLMNGVSPNYLLDLFNTSKYFFLAGWHIVALLLPVVLLRSDDPRMRFCALALPVSLLFALITAFKSGSQYNYFFESLVLIFIALALWIGRAGPVPGANWIRSFVLLYAAVFCAYRTDALRIWSEKFGKAPEHQYAYVADKHVRDVLVNELGLQADDAVFVTYRGYMELFLNGNSLVSQKDIIEWSTDVPYDYTAFHRMMRNGSVRYIITDAPTDTVRFLDSAYMHFRPLRVVAGRHILAPAAH